MDEKQDEDEGRGVTYVFKNPECRTWFRKNIKKKVAFVYRATPELKHIFTAALRNSDAIVGVTGEGPSDARALSEADVGFAMGMDGCDAAKDHADVIMMDDRFATLATAIRFGRNLQDNVRKFLQFQLTVNITTMVFVISTVLILGHSPFNIVQLLWVNLVMDVLAAIAYSTENPDESLKVDRITNKERIITKPMMRQIVFQTGYQLIVMLLVLYVGPLAGGYGYNLFSTEMTYHIDNMATFRCLHQTFMFQCFIVMNLFNMINCRVVDKTPQPVPEDEEVDEEELAAIKEANKPQFNIFTRFWSNQWFWIIFFFEINIQLLIVGYKGTGFFFGTTPLSLSMHLTAILLGLGSWGVAALVKLMGPKSIESMPEFGEDAEALEKATAFQESANTAMTLVNNYDEEEDEEDKHEGLNSSHASRESNLDDGYTAADSNLPEEAPTASAFPAAATRQ